MSRLEGFKSSFKAAASGTVATIAEGTIGTGFAAIGLGGLNSLFGLQDRLVNVISNIHQPKEKSASGEVAASAEQTPEEEKPVKTKAKTMSSSVSPQKQTSEEIRLIQEERIKIHNEFVKAIDILKETKFASKDVTKFVNEMSTAFKEGKSITQKEAGMLVDIMESQKINSKEFSTLLNAQTRSGKSVKEAFMETPGGFTMAGFRQNFMEKMFSSMGLGGVSQVFNLPTRLESAFTALKTKLFDKEEKIKNAIKASERTTGTKLDELKDITDDQTDEMYNQTNTLENIDSSIDDQSKTMSKSVSDSGKKDKDGGIVDWLLGKTGLKGLWQDAKGATSTIAGRGKSLVSGAAGLLSTMGTTAAGVGTVGTAAATAGTVVVGLAGGYALGTGINKGLGALFGLNKKTDKWYEGGVSGWLGEQAYDIYDKSTEAIGKTTSAYIKNTTDYFKNGFTGMKEFGGWIGDTATKATETFTEGFAAVKDAVMHPVDTISKLFQNVMDGFNNMWTWLSDLPVVGKLFKGMSGGVGFVAGKVGAATAGQPVATTTATTGGVSPAIPNAANVRPVGGQAPPQNNIQINSSGGGRSSGSKSMGIDDYGVALANSALFGS